MATTSELRFESTVTLEHFETSLPEYPLEEYAKNYPFRYSDEDFPNLVRALAHHYPQREVSSWAVQFLRSIGHHRHHELTSLHDARHSRTVHLYAPRREGRAEPRGDAAGRQGSCRDFAVLMMEAAAFAGLGRALCQRIYLRSQPFRLARWRGHACLDAGLSAGRRLDRFRSHQQHHRQSQSHSCRRRMGSKQVLPLWGTFVGSPSSFLGMDVTVSVTEDRPEE